MRPIPKITTRPSQASSNALGYIGDFLVDGDRVFACGGTLHKPTMLVSNDGGASWERRAAPRTPGLRQMYRSDDAIYVCGEYGTLAVSVDSALTWTTIPNDASSCLFQLHRHSDGTWWIVGDDGIILRSRDGLAYKQLDADWDTRLLGVTTIDDTLYIFGYDGQIQRWTGSELVALELDNDNAITQILVTSKGSWIVICDGGIAYRSTDNGASFSELAIPGADDLEAILELSQGILVAGGDGTLLFSDDDGASFVRVPNELDGHLWSLAKVGDLVLVGGDDGAIWQMSVSATETMMSEDPPEDDEEEDVDEDDDEPDEDDGAAPVTFASVDEASARWIREGTAFSEALNGYVRKVYEVGPNKAGDEPSETREDMADYVREQVAALNAAGQHQRARELFPPAYEPFSYDGLATSINAVMYLDDGRLVIRSNGSVHFVEPDRIVPVDDVAFFGCSADRQLVAKGHPDRIDIHRGWDGPVLRTLPHVLGDVRSLVVTPDGSAVLAATEAGVYWVTERAMRLMLGDGDSVSYAHAAMSPNGRFVAMGTQDTPHVVHDRKSGRRYTFDPVSSYPHHAIFHHDAPDLVLSSCHGLYGSGSLAVKLDELVAETKQPSRVIDRRAWVHSAVSTSTGYLLGDTGGYVWAKDFDGNQQWYLFLGASLTAMDISPDRRRLAVGSFAGYVIELDLDGGGDPRLLTNGPARELHRWVFWLGHDPMIW